MPLRFDRPMEKLRTDTGTNPRAADFDATRDRALAEMRAVDPQIDIRPRRIRITSRHASRPRLSWALACWTPCASPPPRQRIARFKKAPGVIVIDNDGHVSVTGARSGCDFASDVAAYDGVAACTNKRQPRTHGNHGPALASGAHFGNSWAPRACANISSESARA